MAGAMYLMLFIAAVLAGCVKSQDTCRETLTNYGPIIGKINSFNVGGRLVKVETFWGIPYAKPPIGDWRFMIATNPESWTERRRCWVPPKACLQEVDNDIIHSAEDMSEDCLYFNVWKPLCNITDMAIIVWIHGGSLRSGSSAYPLYNGEYLAARECVVVVSMNYRLGALGLFKTRYSFFTHANNAWSDVERALTVLHVNAEYFGGSNSKITLAGNGAGAYLSSLFLLQHTRRLNFTSVILQSGGPLMKDLHQTFDESISAGKQLARDLQCPDTTDTAMVECLKKVDGVVLTKAYTKMAAGTRHKLVTIGGWGHLERTPLEYLQNGEIKDLPILVGSNRDEGTEILMKIMPSEFNTTVTQPPEFSDQDIAVNISIFQLYVDFLARLRSVVCHCFLSGRLIYPASHQRGYNRFQFSPATRLRDKRDYGESGATPGQRDRQKLDAVLTQFLGRLFKAPYLPHLIATLRLVYDYENMKRETNPTVALLSAVGRDLAYTCPTRTFLEFRANLNLSQNVYMYSFNNVPVSRKLPAWVGATHRTELQYLFETSHNFAPADLSPSETVLSQNMQKMWADFAKYGNPTPDNTVGTQWPPYTPRTSERMMVFTEDAQLNVTDVNNRPCLFWNVIPPEMKV